MLGLNFQVFWDNGTAAEIQNGTGLKLLSAEPGEAVDVLYYVPPANLVSGSYHVWDALESYASKDGVVLKLRFQLPEGKNCKDKYNIWVDSYPDDNPNKDMLPQEFKHEAGKIVSFMPGDVNSNGKLDSIDVTLIRRYVSDGRRTDPNGYNVTLDELAADVNDDGTLSALDVTLIRRFIADGRVTNPDGYNVTLKPSSRTCLHTQRTAHSSKAPTCTEDGTAEYWVCDKCGKYLNRARGGIEIDPATVQIKALGHDRKTIPGKAPTYTESGLSDGVICARCGLILEEQKYIKPLEQLHHSILYDVANKDPYLESLNLKNPNPDSYPELDGLRLQDLDTPGYRFEGWYDGNGKDANRITEIPANSTQDYKLYAHWEKVTYTVQYNTSPLKSKIGSETYTVDTGLTLVIPDSYGYWFLGWTDQNGKWMDKYVKPGEIGNKTLTAHWTSVRNTTYPVVDTDPIMYEEPENGRLVFCYEIGVIRNIPVAKMEEPHSSLPGESYTHVKGVSHTMTKTEAAEVSQTISKTTTDSTSMMLSKDWNNHVEIDKEREHEVAKESVRAMEDNFVINGKWSVGSTTGVSNTTSRQTTDSSSHTEGGSISATIGATTGTEVGAGPAKATASISASVSDEVHFDNTTSHETVDSRTDTATFNSSTGFEQGHSFGQSVSSQESLSERINNKYHYGESHDEGGSQATTNSHETSGTTGRTCTSTVGYSNADVKSEEYTHTIDCREKGHYRLTAGGTAHVFAVVTYDVAEKAYSITTHSIMEPKLVPYMDFSADGSFNDQENGVIPCDIPYSVQEYVSSKTRYTPGLRANSEENRITSYEGESAWITVPEYMSVPKSTGDASVHITGIASAAFAGSRIEKITLPETVTVIPDGAFQNCENLVSVEAPGVTEIGANAFNGCKALTTVHTGKLTSIGGSAFKGCAKLSYVVPDTVTTLGAGSFSGVQALEVNAGSAAVARSAIGSGAAKLTVRDCGSDGLTGLMNVPDTVADFKFDGRGKTYSGLRFLSAAGYTAICNAKFNDPDGIALEISSPRVLLESTTVNSNTLCMKLTAADATVELSDINHMNSTGSAAVLTNNVTFAKYSGTSLDSALATNSKIVVVSKAQGKQWVRPQEAVIEREHATFNLTFNPNGGTVSETSRLAFVGTTIGELPVPTRDYYTFNGWYTAAEGGESVTANTSYDDPFDRTIYAQWTQNPVSDWVKAEDMPDGAQIINAKWTYKETTRFESRKESEPGATQVSSRWVENGKGSRNYASFPYGFDHNHWIWRDFSTSPYTANETSTTKRVVSNSWSGYVYWHWMYSVGYANVTNRTISDRYGSFDQWGNPGGYLYQYFTAFTSSTNCSYLDNGYCCSRNQPSYYCHDILPGDRTHIGTPRFFRFDYHTSYYTDYYKMFTYQRIEDKESISEVHPSDTISHVQKMVRYRAKDAAAVHMAEAPTVLQPQALRPVVTPKLPALAEPPVIKVEPELHPEPWEPSPELQEELDKLEQEMNAPEDNTDNAENIPTDNAENIPEKTASEQKVPEKAASEQKVPEAAASEKKVPEESASREPVPEQTDPETVSTDETAPQVPEAPAK